MIRKGLLVTTKEVPRKRQERIDRNLMRFKSLLKLPYGRLILWKSLIEPTPVDTGFPIPGSRRSRSTAVTGAADKFREVANLRMDGRSSVYE